MFAEAFSPDDRNFIFDVGASEVAVGNANNNDDDYDNHSITQNSSILIARLSRQNWVSFLIDDCCRSIYNELKYRVV